MADARRWLTSLLTSASPWAEIAPDVQLREGWKRYGPIGFHEVPSRAKAFAP